MKTEFEGWASAPPSWITLKGREDFEGVILSSRIRLARNLSGYNFPHHAAPKDQKKILDQVFSVIKTLPDFKSGVFLDLKTQNDLIKEFLLERHLISPEHAKLQGERGLAVSAGESLSVMVNEEDHIRAACLTPGLDLAEAWVQLSALDDGLAQHLPLAYDEEWGAVTACPTNMGTGLRASSLLHLPALGVSGRIQSVIKEIAEMRFIVRGFYGEGTIPAGDLYQISNNQTLGKSESQLIKEVEKVVKGIAALEVKETDRLMNSIHSERLQDRIARATGTLKSARMLSFPETMQHLSMARWGFRLTKTMGREFETMTNLFFLIQPAHVQLKYHAEDQVQEEKFRAKLVQKQLDNI